LLKEITDVDAKGKTTKFITSAGITTSYIWGYDNTLPIAEAVNAPVSQIAYTSFENATSTGGWTYQATCPDVAQCLAGCPNSQTDPAGYAQCSSVCQSATNQCQSDQLLGSKTGNRSFPGSSITKTNLPSDNYMLSFWARKKGSSDGSVLVSGITGAQVISGSEWQYFQFNLNAITQVSLTLSDVLLDELRIHPVSAQMTTYTYNPLIGTTTVTDKNGLIMYYQYDDMGRVKAIKDPNQDIMKAYEYNYQIR
jgi:YD repeat-containing protein